MTDEIIDYIRKNRVSTTEIADCLGKSGALDGVLPINRGHYAVGKVKWVYAYNSSNYTVHQQVIDTEENSIVFIDSINCENRAIIGELVSKYILLYCQAKAIVTNGKMRDASSLIRQNWSIWCNGVTPVGCFNTKPEEEPDADIIRSHKALYDGSIMVCDDCGVVVIPKAYHNEEFLQKIIAIEEQEDIWFDRLDRHKENTFDIVCLKKYLNKD